MRFPNEYKQIFSKKFLTVAICHLIYVLSPCSILGQTYYFASHGGGSEKDEFLDFAVDAAENSYALLQYKDDVTFGGDTYNSSSRNTLLVKHDRNGNQVLTKNIVSEASGPLFGAVGVSDSGVVAVAAATMEGTLDGIPVESGNFIGKLGADGNFEWALQAVHRIDLVRQFNKFRITAVEVSQNAIYVGASTDGRVLINGVTDPVYEIESGDTALLIKISYGGQVQWIKNIPTPGVANHPYINGGLDHILASNDGQSIYVAGKFGDGSYNPYEVAYVAKFKTNGDFLWVSKTSSSGSESWGIAETSSGDLITGFQVGGPQRIDFGNGPALEESEVGWFGALARLDSNGNIKTLKYVADALYADSSNFGVQKLLSLHHLSVNAGDQVFLTGSIVGTHPFNNNLEVTSSSGLLGTSQDMILIQTDLDFNPIEVHANTGANNEKGRKVVNQGSTIYVSGEYDSYSHPFLGTFKPQFGDYTFESAGNLDIFVASIAGPDVPPVATQAEINITQQGNNFILSWPETITGAEVQSSSSLTPDSWGAFGGTPTLNGDLWQVTLPPLQPGGATSVFYRISYPEQE